MKRLLVILLLLTASAFSQVALSPVAKQIFFGSTGTYTNKPLAGGMIYTYTSGTTTPLATYTDASGSTANPNPIILDSAGMCCGGGSALFLTVGTSYRFIVTDALGVQQWDVDNVLVSAGGGGGGGGFPGGPSGSVQYNKLGAFGGDTGFIYDRTTNQATLTGGVNAPFFASTGEGNIPAQSGDIRLPSVGSIRWRNSGNNADYIFNKTSLNQLQWNGHWFVDSSGNGNFNDVTISGTCTGTGCGGVTAPTLTAGVVPVATGGQRIGNSLLNDNGTTLAYSGTGGFNLTAAGVAGYVGLPFGTSQAVGNGIGITADASGTATNYVFPSGFAGLPYFSLNTNKVTMAAATPANIINLWTNCSGTQYLGADGNCYTAAGSGTVTSSGSPVNGNIPKFSSATNLVPASYSDIIGLWTSCSGTQYLGADGTCHTASSGGGGSAVLFWNPVVCYVQSTSPRLQGSYTAAGAPSAVFTTGSGTTPNSCGAAFPASTPGTQFMEWHKILEPQYPSNNAGQVTWQWYVDTTDTGNVVWAVQFGCGVDSAIIQPTYAASQKAASVAGTGVAKRTLTSVITTPALTCSAGSSLWARTYLDSSSTVTAGTNVVLTDFQFIEGPVNALTTAASVIALFTGCSGTQYLGADGACHTGGGGGSGNVTSSGSPVAGDLARFTSATDITTAVAGNIINLFTGCSGTQYLGADGACHTGGGIPGGSSGQLQFNNGGTFGGFTLTGDFTINTSTGVGRNTGMNGVTYSSLATGILKNTTGTGIPSIAVAGDFPTLNQSTTGNAATATALAGTPVLCPVGQAPIGILASGNATGCAVLGGNTTSTALTSGNIPVANGTNSIIDSTIPQADIALNSTLIPQPGTLGFTYISAVGTPDTVLTVDCTGVAKGYPYGGTNGYGCDIPAGSGGTSNVNFGQAFTGQTSVTIAGTSHNFATTNLVVACYDNSAPENEIFPLTKTINTSTYDVVVTFAVPQSGRCVVNGSGPVLYSASLSANTTWTITAATHGLGTKVIGALYDGAGNRVDPQSFNVDGSGNVTVTVAVAAAYTINLTN